VSVLAYWLTVLLCLLACATASVLSWQLVAVSLPMSACCLSSCRGVLTVTRLWPRLHTHAPCLLPPACLSLSVCLSVLMQAAKAARRRVERRPPVCALACGQLYAAILELSMSPMSHRAAISCQVRGAACFGG
jgi:hypothetical protein